MKSNVKLALAAVGALLAVPLVGPNVTASAQPAAACSTTPTDGDKAQVEYATDGDSERLYRLFVPDGLTGAAPLIVALHGGHNTPEGFEAQSGWTKFAKNNNVIVAYPRGSKEEWGGTYAWEFARNVGPDVDFLRNVVDDISNTYCVASDRVHFVGHSNGGQMTSRMACDAADMIASAAVWAGPKGAWDLNDCPASRPIAFGVMLNDNDPIVWQVIAEQHRDHWVAMNNCGPAQTESAPGVVLAQRFDCDAGTEVVYRVYDGPDKVEKAHVWPEGDKGATIRNEMWELFQANHLPQP